MSQNHTEKIGLSTATIVSMNAMIGAGIFALPAALASNVGPAGILAYLFVVASVWFMGLSLARVAHLFPDTSSFYAYVKPWAGHLGGTIATISYFLGLLFGMALQTQNASLYLHAFIPLSPTVLGIIILTTLVLLNMFGIALSRLGQRALIACTIFPLIAIILICLTHFDLANLTPFAPYGIRNVLAATRIVIFGFFGFECASLLSSSIKNPARNVPRALTYSIAIVGTLYFLFVASIILSVPQSFFEGTSCPLLTDALRAVMPGNTLLIGAVHVAILSAILGTVHSQIWSSNSLLSTLTELLAKHSKLPFRLTQQQCAPILGILIFLIFALVKNQMLFFGFAALFVVSTYIASMITLLTIRQEWSSGRNLRTLIGLATAGTILYFAIELIATTLW